MGQRRLSLANRLILSTTTVGVLLATSLVLQGNSLGPALLNSGLTPNVQSVMQSVPAVSETVDTTSSTYVAKYLDSYFSDMPIMAEIAKCESRNRQYDKKGAVLRGVVNKKDRGALQINETYHLETSKKMGLNIYTLEGNASYARHLFEKQGVKPWKSSSPCWRKTSAYADYLYTSHQVIPQAL